MPNKLKKLISLAAAIAITLTTASCAKKAEETDLSAMLSTAQKYLVEFD